jgi:beta-mannosidase
MSNLEIKLENWECRQVNGDISWIPATVPSNIHLELLKANIIPDPFIDTNEDQVQWVGEVDWV